jgi:hypothetical protein
LGVGQRGGGAGGGGGRKSEVKSRRFAKRSGPQVCVDGLIVAPKIGYEI